MEIDYHFRMAEKIKDLDVLRNFLLENSLNYKRYSNWVDKAIGEFEFGWKKVLLAFYKTHLIANLIFQPNKEFPSYLLELKNGRVSKPFQERLVFGFMLRQVECLAIEDGFQGITGDCRTDRYDMIYALKKYGFKELCRAPLYESNFEDAILSKNLSKEENLFLPFKEKILRC